MAAEVFACDEDCPQHRDELIELATKKPESPVFLVRTDSNDLIWPRLNIYQSFEESCRQHKVIGEEGQLLKGIVDDNLEYVLNKRLDAHEQDAFQLGQVLLEKVRLQ